MASRENLPGIKFTPSDTQYLDSRGFVVVRSEADRETPSQSNLPLSPKWLSAFWPDSRSRASFFDRGLFLGSWAFQQVLRAVKFRLFRLIREHRRQSQPILEKLQSQIGGCLATRVRRSTAPICQWPGPTGAHGREKLEGPEQIPPPGVTFQMPPGPP